MTEDHFSLDNLILKTHVGSRLYGTNIVDNPDTDTYGIAIEPPEIALGLGLPFTHYRYGTTDDNTPTPLGGQDNTIVSLRHFMRQCSKGNPDALMVLSLTPSQVLYVHPIAQELWDHRERFISREAARAVDGFITNHIKKYLGDTITPARQYLAEEYGWDTKAGYIALRTLRHGIELMRDGQMTIPMNREWVTYLKDVRLGRIAKNSVLGEIGSMRDELKHTANMSNWPELTQTDELSTWCTHLYQKYWRFGKILAALPEEIEYYPVEKL